MILERLCHGRHIAIVDLNELWIARRGRQMNLVRDQLGLDVSGCISLTALLKT